MSSRLALAPRRVNASFATPRMRSRLRCASVRGFRSAGFELFLAIQKYLQPEIVSGYLISNSETLSVLLELPVFVNSGKEYQHDVESIRDPQTTEKSGLRRLAELGGARVGGLLRSRKRVVRVGAGELSAEEWLRELEATDDLPASTPEWQTLTAKASLWLANRVTLSLTTEF